MKISKKCKSRCEMFASEACELISNESRLKRVWAESKMQIFFSCTEKISSNTTQIYYIKRRKWKWKESSFKWYEYIWTWKKYNGLGKKTSFVVVEAVE